jgi:hypothetical protein
MMVHRRTVLLGNIGDREHPRSRPAAGGIMPHSLVSATPARNSPTLWPLSSDERTSIEFAAKAFEEENRVLKYLIVSLSEIILNDVLGNK